MTPLKTGRDPFHMRARYALALIFGVGMCALFAAMIVDRRDLEPIVRFFHPLMLGGAGRYERNFYIAYEAAVVLLGLLPFVTLAWATATKSRTDRKIDSYLAERMPHHEDRL